MVLKTCTKCRKLLIPDSHYLDITTEDETIFYFCPPCVREGYNVLAEKPDKTKAERDLMKGLKDFLKEHKMLFEA